MKLTSFLICACLFSTAAFAQDASLRVERDIPYAEPADPLQKLDVYAPPDVKNAPVMVYIHGGGWEQGDKAQVKEKPAAFAKKGFVFVSVNYRLWPKVPMGDIIRDCAKATGWVHAQVAKYGGDPHRLFVMGHSAGAQLAALLCTDERYFQAEGVPFSDIKGCVPVDGDTYDVSAIIAIEETQRRVYSLPDIKNSHENKFGTPEQWKDYSAVTHVAKGKGIPPFLVLHVAANTHTSGQARQLARILKEADVPLKVFGAKNTEHSKLNDDLGVPGDPATNELFDFIDQCLKP